jgi:hypothetical protein
LGWKNGQNESKTGWKNGQNESKTGWKNGQNESKTGWKNGQNFEKHCIMGKNVAYYSCAGICQAYRRDAACWLEE